MLLSKGLSIIVKVLLVLIITIPKDIFAQPTTKPPDKPKIERAIKRCENIVIAKYKGYENPYSGLENIDFFTGPLATYEIIAYIKGKPLPKDIQVSYPFNHSSSCKKPEGWEFKESLMPKKDSTWILMLEISPTGDISTYRGSFGRLEATERNIKKIKKKV